MTAIERRAALAVLGAATAVTVAGVKLIKRHTAYVLRQSAAFFDRDEKNKEMMSNAGDTGSQDQDYGFNASKAPWQDSTSAQVSV